MSAGIPPAAERLMRWSLAPWERPAVLGDLEEDFHEIRARQGEAAARRWYWHQAITSIWPNVIRRARGDERRMTQLRMQAATAACGLIYVVMSTLEDRRSTFAFGVLLLALSSVGASSTLFRRRFAPPKAQTTALRRTILVFFALAFWPASGPAALGWLASWLIGAVLIGMAIWPRWPADPEPAEIRVGAKADANDDPTLTVAVPNTPLGMSGLVLSLRRGPDPTGHKRRTLAEEPTLHRTFNGEDSVRVCAVVNLAGSSADATVGLIDESGAAVVRQTLQLRSGQLELRPSTWDDIAEEDPADHFGEIDVTIRLAELEPGPYSLRVSVTDGVRRTTREEEIRISESESSRRRASPTRARKSPPSSS